MYADVVLPLPLEDTFTYALPSACASSAQVGCRVIVSFGVRKIYTGIIARLHEVKPDYEVKEVLELLDEQPVVLPQQMRMWQWISRYYLCTLGDVFKAALPSGMKLESESVVMLNVDFEASSSLRPAAQQVLDALEEKGGPLKITQLEKLTGLSPLLPVVKRLLDMGAVEMKEEVQRTFHPKTLRCVRLSEAFLDAKALSAILDTMEKRSPKQHQLLMCYLDLSRASSAIGLRNAALLERVPKADLLRKSGQSASVFKALCDKAVLETYEETVGRLPDGDTVSGEILLHPLSDAQQQAMEQVAHLWQTHRTVLLHGVTSSGKTEIYIHLIKRALDEGKQVLYLLPEIVLTAQLTERLRRVFGNRLGVYHSKYPDAERVEVYQKMLSDHPYQILVGVRSSVFLPFHHLGLVIVDEEHETSFKQQDPAPRYHARNAALVLAAQAGAYTLLGSATPSMESYFNASRGKYGLVTLSTRYRDVELPRIEVVDVRELRRKRLMSGPFSPRLLEVVREAVQGGRQAILFQNRRGFAPQLECHDCGWVPRCQNCDVSLTVHRQGGRLVCHYCGVSYVFPTQCPNCGCTQLHSRGYGTERIEDLIHEAIPEARVARMDLDTTRSRQHCEQIIQDFQQGRTDILVGTQMVTKGLDFDKVSVVGILSADTMLNQPDFRSHERAFQLMEQVAGRAGRRGSQGRVILQTRDPESPVIRQVMAHDFLSLYKDQMEERRLFTFPPFCRIIYVYVKHRDEHVADRLSQTLAAFMRQVFATRVYGPDTPFVARVQLMYVRKLMLKMELEADLMQVRDRLLQIRQAATATDATFRSAQIYFDVE